MVKKKKLSGITLIETILYLGIAVLVMGALFSYGWDIAGASIKNSVIRETTAAVESVERIIVREIRQAESVDRGNSNFGSSPAKIVLQKTGQDDVTIEITDGQAKIRRGSGDPIILHSPDIRMDNFIFTEQVSSEEETEYVGFSFDAVADYPGSSQQRSYQFSSAVSSGASLRNH